MEHKTEEADKHVKILADRHRKLNILSAKEGKEMSDIINEVFDMYYEKVKDSSN